MQENCTFISDVNGLFGVLAPEKEPQVLLPKLIAREESHPQRKRRGRRGGKRRSESGRHPEIDLEGDLDVEVVDEVQHHALLVTSESCDNPHQETHNHIEALRLRGGSEEVNTSSDPVEEQAEPSVKLPTGSSAKSPLETYPSARGLQQPRVSAPRINHLFNRPIELLANSECLVFDTRYNNVKGRGRLMRLVDRWADVSRNPAYPLTRVEVDALRADDTLRFFAAMKDDSGKPLPLAKKFFKKLRILEFMRGTFDALMLAFQQIKEMRLLRKPPIPFNLGSDKVRMINRLKLRLLDDPVTVAKDIKRWSGIARSHYFGDKTVELPSLLRGLDEHDLIHFSFVGRALPPPPKDVSLLDEYVERLQSDPPPEPEDWRPFLKQYFEEHKPSKPVEYRTDPSISSSLGYTRENGGFTSAVQSLATLGMCLQVLDKHKDRIEFRTSLPFVDLRGRGTGRDSTGFYKPFEWESRIPDYADLGKFYLANEGRSSALLATAVHAVLGTLTHIPLLPIYAEEKGLKVRYPATTMAAATLVYQLFRRAVDSHLVTDPAVSASLGGPIKYRHHELRCSGPGEFIYSQDLSCATDLHPFWLTRGIYEEILPHHPRLKEWEPYFGKLFGPHLILRNPDKDSILTAPVDKIKATYPLWMEDKFTPDPKGPGGIPRAEMSFNNRKFLVTDDLLKEMADFVRQWECWLDAINSLPRLLTTTSASMGDATSFPGLPMLTLYACHKAALDKKTTCGDDAVIAGMTPEKEVIFEKAITDCGGVLSTGDPAKGKPNKIFKHSSRYCFCEEIYEAPSKGKRPRLKPTVHISLWAAPYGGSKGSIDWFNQPSSARQHYDDVGLPLRSGLWTRSKTYALVSAAYKLGVPVGSEIRWGGISHPKFPVDRAGPNPPDNQLWLSAISQLTKFDLALGTGLSVLPTGTTQFARSVSRKAVEALGVEDETQEPALTDKKHHFTGEVNPSLKDTSELLMRVITSWESYVRRAPKVIQTPSVARLASKFHSKLVRITKKKKLRNLNYADTMTDVARKEHCFVATEAANRLTPKSYLMSGRFYGLLGGDTPKADKLTQQWQHLSEFRVDRGYVTQKSDSLPKQAKDMDGVT